MINHLAEDSELRRRGFGMALLNDCMKNKAKDCTRFYAWIDEKNRPSGSLFNNKEDFH